MLWIPLSWFLQGRETYHRRPRSIINPTDNFYLHKISFLSLISNSYLLGFQQRNILSYSDSFFFINFCFQRRFINLGYFPNVDSFNSVSFYVFVHFKYLQLLDSFTPHHMTRLHPSTFLRNYLLKLYLSLVLLL